MAFNDDDQIVLDSDKKNEGYYTGWTKLEISNNDAQAPVEETNVQITLEITTMTHNGRSGVDIVTILDVSMGMRVKKFQHMKLAMRHLMDQLGPIDRLSVVTMSNGSERLCPLRQMNDNGKFEIEKLINDLSFKGRLTNIKAGLETALRVLHDRNYKSDNHVDAIILMSAGDQSRSFKEANKFPVGNVPVYTIRFRNNSPPRTVGIFEIEKEEERGIIKDKVLYTVANNTEAGMFSIRNGETTYKESQDLKIAFSKCLDELLIQPFLDVKLAITPKQSGYYRANDVKPTILHLSGTEFLQAKNDPGANGSRVISFGNLCSYEKRKVVVDLHLPAVHSEQEDMVVFDVRHSFRIPYDGEGRCHGPPMLIDIARKGTIEQMRHAIIEQKHVEFGKIVKDTTVVGSIDKLQNTTNNFVMAGKGMFEDMVLMQQTSPLIDVQKSEVDRLLRLMDSTLQGHVTSSSSMLAPTNHVKTRFGVRRRSETRSISLPNSTTIFDNNVLDREQKRNDMSPLDRLIHFV